MRTSINTVPAQQQHGVALLTVLLVFVLAGVVVSTLVFNQRLDIYRAGNVLVQNRLQLLVMSGEELAREMLWSDFESDLKSGDASGQTHDIDSLYEAWAEPVAASPADGVVEIAITDAQSTFNINNLVKDEEADPIFEEAFKNYLGLLSVSRAEEVTRLAIDEIMLNGEVKNLGQLLMKAEVDKADVAIYLGCVSVLPANSPLNLNTASELTLQAWESLIVPNQREDLLLERKRNKGLTNLPSLPGDLAYFSLGSSFYKVTARATYQERALSVDSLLFLDKGGKIAASRRSLVRFSTEAASYACIADAAS